MFGFLNIYKPQGKTSHDIISILRRITKIKQIGHTGTLDPFAEGVLPVCIGKATRLIEYLKDDKAYIGTIQFGQATSTYDIEGEIINISDKKISLDEIKKVLTNFQGEIEQLPPMYSAIKVNGKKLYEYARKGEMVEIKPRQVTINKLEIINFDTQNQTLELYIDCSKGTYIRSIANDLGKTLGVYGHLIKLVRIKAGDFELKNSVHLEDLNNKEDILKYLIQPLDKLNYPKYELNEWEKEKISHGNSIKANCQDGIILLTYNKTLVAVGEANNQIIKCQKVLLDGKIS